ncbi:hypothetical protein ACUJ46_00095 [Sandaracinobacteroides sp. A072]|uniref:hypothetical protein n=1 Tax=Sandaracinobacteroides sp. A072 TaxID=3461146 RepID=UPI0040424FED
MPLLSSALLALPRVDRIDEEQRLFLKAARMWVMLARAGRSPRAPVRALLGPAASGFGMMMEMMVAAWPDPFTCHPPCAAALTHDEATLTGLLGGVARGDAAAAHAVLEDLLPAPVRERLVFMAGRLVADRAGLD